MLSLGMLCARAISITLRSRGLPVGSPPPMRAATLISFENLLKIVARLTSSAPLARLTLDHLLCPAMKWGWDELQNVLAGHTCDARGGETGTPRKKEHTRRQTDAH